jgi:hypothetical protein
MNYTIDFDHQMSVFLNEFSSTLGQITAGVLSTMLLLPVYNYYNNNVKSIKKD